MSLRQPLPLVQLPPGQAGPGPRAATLPAAAAKLALAGTSVATRALPSAGRLNEPPRARIAAAMPQGMAAASRAVIPGPMPSPASRF